MLNRIIVFLNKNALTTLLVWVFVLSLLYSSLSIIRHNHFQSGGFDLGIFDQAVWQYAHFLSPYNTIKDKFILGDHLTLTLPLLAPLYYLWDNVRMLLIFQALWMSISTLPIFLLIRKRGFSSLVALLLAIAYSLFFSIQYSIFFDFHPNVIGAGLLAWIAYFLESKKKKLFLFSCLLTAATQENMGIAIAGIGLCYIFLKEYRKTAMGMIIGGILVSILAIKIVGIFSPTGYQYSPNVRVIFPTSISVFFDTQDKRQIWLYSLSGFAFLPLLSPGAIAATLLDLSQYFFLGKDFSWMQGPFTHHRVTLAIFMLLGTVEAMRFLGKKKIKPEIVAMVIFVSTVGLQFFFHYPLNKLSKREFVLSEAWMKDDAAILKLIPQKAGVAAPQNLVPHISHRKEVYLIYPHLRYVSATACQNVRCWWLDFSGKPEYLVVDRRTNQWVTQILESNEHFEQAIVNMEKENKIKKIKQIGDAYLYKVQ